MTKRFVGTIVLIGILVLLLLMSISSVPTGHTGILTSFGKVEDTTFEAGLHFKAPWKSVIKMDNRVRMSTFDLSCFSSDIQEVSLNYNLNYQIDKDNAQILYRTVGKNYFDTVIVPVVKESVKVAVSHYTAEQLVNNRNELAILAENEVIDRLKQYNIQVVSTAVQDIDFTDAYTNAVEAKQVAQQDKLRAQTEAEKNKIEAQAAADIKVIEAQAAADAMLIEAEAEAAANEKVSASLTDNILLKTYYDKWNGELPKTILGESSNPIINNVE